MDKVRTFIQKEFQRWSRFEIIGYFTVVLIILLNSVLLKDSPVAVISAFCGITYTFIAGKGKISCYFFGLCGSGFYGYLAFRNAFFGNFLLYTGYYIPMQILGIFRWKQNLNKKTNEIYKTYLSAKERLLLIILSVSGSAVLYFVLKHFGDTNPVPDSISTTLSIVGMYLTVRRCIEQWVIWGIVNFLCCIMWIKPALAGEKVYSTILMWITYFILSIYFYIKWRDELNKKETE